ncbi:MAG: SAM-dependent methyltransferase [Labilithrix sp.]|nr:SAM-dependent methyltransferase [Labilithrix sp.]
MRHMSSACLVCKTPIEPFIDFGRMPIANGFLTQAEVADEWFFDLRVGYCSTCHMVQLTELVDRERMFHDQYAFFSSTSTRMAEHFKRFAEDVKASWGDEKDPFVVEIGSNDGITLRNFAAQKIRHLGVEPSANVAEEARKKGVDTICKFFDADTARAIVAEHGQADAFIAANVMCHIPYIHSVVEGIAILLKPNGVVMYEDPYLGDIVQKVSYDQVYDEHAFYFSVASVSYLFGQHGMEVVDVIPQETHGGSMRYVIAHEGARPVSPRVAAQRALEEQLGLMKAETYEELRRRIERSRDALVALLKEKKAEGKRVVGYAATSKSTTVTNYCGIGPDLVEFISDTTPIKQGKLSPGTHIPVKAYAEFQRAYPDYALLFGWNHSVEIMAKEEAFRAAGGKWLVYVPEVKVMG